MSAVSGRVVEFLHDDTPHLRLVADSIAWWARAYSRRVVADDYLVEEGLGDYRRLASTLAG
ncbi:MAG TPA: hypothetical protein VF469_25955 [Kofleriaceae bacterium]